MSAATPGQAAYEAYAQKVTDLRYDRAWPTWDTKTNVEMFGWDAAARAGHAAIAAQEPHAAAERDDYAARLRATDQSWAKVAAERDGAYRERARLVAFLAACYRSVIMHDADDDAPGWSVIFIDAPTGQMSWHLAESDLDLFRHVAKVLKHYPSPWDGHTTDQKYERLAELIPHATDDREQVRLARADRDALRKAVLDLAAEYGDASEHDSIDGYTPGSLYMAVRAELLNAAGARIRKELDI